MPPINISTASVRNSIGIMAALFAGWFFLDGYFAHAEDLDQYKVDTIETMQNFRLNYVVDQLNDLQAKEQLDEMTQYDRIKKDRLEVQLKVMTSE